jgi:hypothetical protein
MWRFFHPQLMVVVDTLYQLQESFPDRDTYHQHQLKPARMQDLAQQLNISVMLLPATTADHKGFNTTITRRRYHFHQGSITA